MATQLSRTFGSQGNQRKFTISVWVKRSNLTAGQSFFGSGGSGNYATNMYFSGETIRFWNYFNGSYAGQKYSSAVFRDPSAWYHIVFRVDTTSATASERMRVYVNGEEISYATSVNPSQNQTMEIGHTGTHYIGGYGTGAQAEMCMSHYHYCDGQSYAPTEFGEYDANGVWKIKLEPSVSYGVSGHFLFNNDASVTDQSGLGNNWSVNGGTLTQTEDNPSNVFCTWNPLQWTLDGPGNPPNTSFGNGNTSVLTSASSGDSSDVWGTLGADTGKFYHEVKMTNNPSDSGNTSMSVGWGNPETGQRITYYGSNGYKYTSSGSAAYGASFTQNDIIGCAVDLTNGTIEFYKNGVSQGQITGEITTNTGFWQPLSWDGSGSLTASWDANFGNGYFGTTAVASAGTNASGIGIFEYDVPTGYTALSTKGLNL